MLLCDFHPCIELARQYKAEGKGKTHLERLIEEAREAVESLTQETWQS